MGALKAPIFSQIYQIACRCKLDLCFSAPALKNDATRSVLVILWCLENKKNDPTYAAHV